MEILTTLDTDSTIIVLAPKFLAELNKLPNNVLSMEEAVNDVSSYKTWTVQEIYSLIQTLVQSMETKYTKIETHVPIVPHTITGKLTPALCTSSNRDNVPSPRGAVTNKSQPASAPRSRRRRPTSLPSRCRPLKIGKRSLSTTSYYVLWPWYLALSLLAPS